MARRVGIVHDRRYQRHKTGLTHPESAARLQAVDRMIARRFAQRLREVHPVMPSAEQLKLVHTPEYLRQVLATAGVPHSSLGEDTPCSSSSYMAAWLAVGGCLAGVAELLAGRLDSCFALVRPPGHHATSQAAGGFCIINNLAVAARWAVEGLGLDRVLIVDWDVHHGNGLQEIFYRDPTVLYFSSHYRGAYPPSGGFNEVGEGPGKGFNVNLELDMHSSDDDMVSLYSAVLGPLLQSFRPQIILVAAGFDAMREDPLGRLRLSAEVFGRLTLLVRSMATRVGSPPMLLALEGGYEPEALACGVGEVLEALLQDDAPDQPPPAPSELCAGIIEQYRQAHQGLPLY